MTNTKTYEDTLAIMGNEMLALNTECLSTFISLMNENDDDLNMLLIENESFHSDEDILFAFCQANNYELRTRAREIYKGNFGKDFLSAFASDLE